MNGSGEHEDRTRGRLATLLAEVSTEALGTVGGRVGGVYLRTDTPGLLRLAVIAGLPKQLFRPWWRLHADRPFPVADSYRLGVQVVLPDATETMRRYPQFAAGLPFQFGSMYLPVVGETTTFGVLVVLHPAAPDAVAGLPDRDRVAQLAEDLGADLRELAGGDESAIVWEGEPMNVRPPSAARPERGRVGRFTWDPAGGTVTPDARLRAMLALPAGEDVPDVPTGPGVRDAPDGPGGNVRAEAFADAVAPGEARRFLGALRDTGAGRPPALPLRLHAGDGSPRWVELWAAETERPSAPEAAAPGPEAGLPPDPGRAGGCLRAEGGAASPPAAPAPPPASARTAASAASGDRTAGAGGGPGPGVHGLVVDPGRDAMGDSAADLLPGGVFCLDRTGLVRYVNPPAARLLGPAREELLGRPLWEPMPWWSRSPCDDHLRAALLSPEPVHFQVRRPDDRGRDSPAPSGEGDGGWLALSVYPGPDLLTCTVAPVRRLETPEPDEVEPTGPRLSRLRDDTAAPPGGAAVTAPFYRPIALAIALTDAVTARQVSAVVMRELLPAFGGRRLAIYLLQERHLYLAWESGFPQGFLAPFDGVGLDARLPGVETLTSGRPQFYESMDQLTAAYPGMPVDAHEGSRAFLPLIASGRPVGSCILGFERSRSFSTEERTVLTALAGLIAHAMERAQRYDSEAALARGLQQALLPRRLTEHPHVETAGRYLPGTEGMDVGGDWYDAVEAGDGLALVIGDVQGHGVQAAATMGQLRSAVRAFALSDQPADLVLSGTNRLLIDLDPGQFASCCYVRLDPVTGLACFARAGHLPPLLRAPDGRTRVLDLPGGVVLGVDPHARYPMTELHIEYDAVLALYTDGLVERPGADIDDGITALRVALARAGALPGRRGGRSLSGTADRLTANARHSADRPDDVALLLAARRERPRAGRR
ncbi:SpoIIE family protein phosphatase [Streptomyces sp. NPDC047000]|uniref:SpoIIE family protein phosphatase n=1 Tax=Streptomyces sp. NPDC047000 TaxID=3155474 RepID=UPI003410A3AF